MRQPLAPLATLPLNSLTTTWLISHPASPASIARSYELNPNLEIIGLGIANFIGAAFNCYTTTGSFSRSSVNNESGEHTTVF